MNFADQLIIYQGNVLPFLLKKLSQQLQISEKTLTTLGIGYALRIPLKKGKAFRDCWVFPERDEQGIIIGLSLRQWDGRKWMVPDSKRGLTYVPNIHRSITQPEQYHAGPENWVRTSTDTCCPICEKPDWCLVSAENPTDPKAVLCCRIRKGSVKDLGTAGFLHIRKTEGLLTPIAGTILAPSEQPVLIVEGVTDVAAGMDLGFVAVGRPSSSGCLDKLPALVAGRRVIVLGENDAGVGREGMEAAFEVLQSVVKTATKLMPPEGIKDLRQWVKQGLTQEQFQKIVQRTGNSVSKKTVLLSIAPLDLARQWLENEHCLDEIFTLRVYHNSWYAYNGRYYEEIDRTVLRQELYQFLDGKLFKKIRASGFDILNYEPTKHKIDEIMDALLAFCPITSGDIPCWIDKKFQMIDPRHILVFPNGWLDINDYLRGGKVHLCEPTPRFFSLACYPYDFNPDASCILWEKFLRELFGDDPTKITLLQEWFGYNLVPDNSHEKFMLFLGPTRAGKGTILDVLTYILGDTQVLATSLKNFTRRFGLFPFFGKLAAVIGDVSTGMNYDATEALNCLKRITGNDAVTLERKGRDITQTCVKLFTRFTMAANVMPRFPDYARTIEARILILQFLISFAGREDITLKDRLKVEAPGILLWALEGLKRLRQQKMFTLPVTHEKILQQIRGDLTPLTDFIVDCCEFGDQKEFFVSREHLFDCWKQWAIKTGERVNSTRWLNSSLIALYPSCTSNRRVMKNGQRKRVFFGIRLTSNAARELGVG